MQLCPNCGHNNRAGIVFCENCGASLIGKAPLDTKSLDQSTEEEKAQIGVDSSVITDTKVQGVAVFDEGASLRLEIEGSPESILFKPKAETIFGRRDPATGAMPDIDLTPFAGYRMGVSRRHAAIRFGDAHSLDLWDLGSSNGTFLNGQRLSAHRPYRMRDGDELRLGQMVITVAFQPSEKPLEAAAPAAGEAPQPAPEAEKPAPAGPQPVTYSTTTTISSPAPSAAPAAKAPAAPAPSPEEAAPKPGTAPLGEKAAAPAPAKPVAPAAEAPAPAKPEASAAAIVPAAPAQPEVPAAEAPAAPAAEAPKPVEKAEDPKPEKKAAASPSPEAAQPEAATPPAPEQPSSPPPAAPGNEQKRD